MKTSKWEQCILFYDVEMETGQKGQHWALFDPICYALFLKYEMLLMERAEI